MPDPSATELRGHIDAAHAAAERLVREASERASRAAGDVPPRGWDVGPDHRAAEAPSELATVLALLEAIRSVVPDELSVQLADAIRELLLAVRALIDWYLDRLERGPVAPGGDGRVEDIPIL